jgi:hypothetical protein
MVNDFIIYDGRWSRNFTTKGKVHYLSQNFMYFRSFKDILSVVMQLLCTRVCKRPGLPTFSLIIYTCYGEP